VAGAQYGVTDDLYDVEAFLDDVARFCQAQAVPAGAVLSEYAGGQYEINLHHVDDPLLACDHAVLLKRAIKAAARRHGMAATFMAKPFEDVAGSGTHVHVSLLDEAGDNVFAGECEDGPFSERLRHAVGGLAAAMAESMAIFAPNANSYRRYAPHSFVPGSPNWGPNHRSLALRIPLSGPANTRIEHRVAGADANPYLVVAAVLAGIHHGLENAVEPGPMVAEGSDVEHEETLPTRWPLALDAFGQGTILPRYLGREYHDLFLACRREEEGAYNAGIPPQDYAWYLRGV
jgi:glutamine synthetase